MAYLVYSIETLNFYLKLQKRGTVAYENSIALRCRFKMIFDFLCDEEYREVWGAQRPLGTLGAEKSKST